jgi:hypothetical protein
LISLRPSLITEHHFVSFLNDLAPKTSHHAPRNSASGWQTDSHEPSAVIGNECPLVTFA